MNCKKIKYHSGEDSPTILWGLIYSEDDFFIYFKTANKKHRISKKAIISINDSNKVFRGELKEEKKENLDYMG